MKADTTSSWIAACDEVRHALEEYGCFVAVYDKVCLELNDAIIGGMEALFSLPLETKSKNISKMPCFRVRRNGEEDGIPKLRRGEVRFRNWIIHLLLKLMKYKAPTEGESNIGSMAWKCKQRMEWMGLEPRPSSFVVMAGNAFMVFHCFNGRIPSPNHRVLMSGDQARYSLALFSFNDGVIQVPEEVVDDEHPLKFKPFDGFGYFRFCMAHVGKRKFEHLIEEICGV
ncbi:hypothetical protein RJ639_004161 [Escallonia herrerae]|uniref:Isopenicillin N synthase-like Fe(2+) 2OG dioxygenase domain-containing protein n=1 Tax=Escallonia herrerae TaxID=1293975 RepID=A0AA88W214_9ASTE|nr:hypothetical protein RJ639_004161 [Escallonia herrerae]